MTVHTEERAARRPLVDNADERLRRLVGRLVDSRNVAQAVIGVTTTDGEFEWIGAAGTGPDESSMQTDTPYWIASVTKLFIAAAVLRLHERGAIDLEASITSYLPSHLTSGLHRDGDQDRTEEVTVRHLLSHTSGLADYWDDFDSRSLYRRLAGGEDPSWTMEDVVRLTRAAGPHFPPQDLDSRRQKARYSDTNFQLLIAILEAVTGDQFAWVLERELLDPLGLTHTYLPGSSRPLLPTPPAVGPFDKDRPLDLPRALASSRDLISTAADTLRFQRTLVSGALFDSPATYGLMHERWNRIYYPLRYGLGTMQFRIGRLYAPGNEALELVGHSGVVGSWLFHCPELGVITTGTVNQMGGRSRPFRLLPRILRACFG